MSSDTIRGRKKIDLWLDKAASPILLIETIHNGPSGSQPSLHIKKPLRNLTNFELDIPYPKSTTAEPGRGECVGGLKHQYFLKLLGCLNI